MKFKKIMLVSFLLLAVLTIGAVSALEDADVSDDAASEISAPADGDGQMSVSDEPSLSKEDLDIDVKLPDKVYYGHNEVDIKISNSSASGSYKLYVDAEDEDTESEQIDGTSFSRSVFAGFGKHNLYFKYSDDELFNDREIKIPFEVTDYRISIGDDTFYYGVSNYITVNTPYLAYGDYALNVNGNYLRNFSVAEDDWDDGYGFWVRADELNYGNNSVKIQYTPAQNSQFKAKTVETTIHVIGRIEGPSSLSYGNDALISITLPGDASGNLSVSIDGGDAILVPLTGGKATYKLPKLGVGEHNMDVDYIGDERYEAMYVGYSVFEVKPKVTYSSYVNVNDDNNRIAIEMDEKYKGNVTLYRYIYDEDDGYYTVMNRTNLVNGKAEFSLNDIRLGEKYTLYWAYDEDGDEIFRGPEWGDYEITGTNVSREWKMDVDVADTLLKYSDQYIEIKNVPDILDSPNYELYIDGAKIDSVTSGYDRVQFDASDLAIGSHSFELKFLGDSYFSPDNVSGKFNVGNVSIYIPETYNMDLDDTSITILLLKDATGTVTVKANNQVIYSEKIKKEDDYIFMGAGLLDLEFGVNDIEVVVTGTYPTTKTGKINATYTLGIAQSHVRYGEGRIVLDIPQDATSDATIVIDGVSYNATRNDGSDFTAKIPADLSVGNHAAVIRYPGDDRYGAKESEVQFAVYPEFTVPEGNIDKTRDKISLQMPEDAKGNLTVQISNMSDGNYVFLTQKSVKVSNGSAVIFLDDLSWGNYQVNVNYTGDDYEVLNNFEDGGRFTILPQITYSTRMIITGTDAVTINLPGEKGYIALTSDDFYETANLVNGKASIPLKYLPAGNNTLYFEFHRTYQYVDEGETQEGDELFDSYIYILVQKPTIKASNVNAIYTNAATFKVKVANADKSFIAGDKVTFKLKGKTIGTGKIDKNGYASIKLRKNPGSYKITAEYRTAKVTKTLTVKHVVALKTVKVKKSAKKLVIIATLKKGKTPLKNKKVTFKFNGKTYTAKTNKKGVAKVTVKKAVLKKLKVGKKITYQATYLKDTVKKSVKVKK